jgi:hypothetical protein
MAEAIDVNNFIVKVNDSAYNVTVSYQDLSISRFKVEADCKYLFTLYMNEEGIREAEKMYPCQMKSWLNR